MELNKKYRIKEQKIELENKYNIFPNSSLLVLDKYSEFEESFFDTFENKKWVNIAIEIFTSCFVNLLISGRINAVYFLDKKYTFYNLIIYKSEGFNIYLTENPILYDDDLLTDDILSILQKTKSNEKENFPLVVNKVINRYIGMDHYNRPEKKFFYKYLIKYSMKFPSIKLKPNNKLLGLITNYEVEIENGLRNSLIKSSDELNSIKDELMENNLLFRNFLEYIERIVFKDFQARYNGD